MKFQWIFIFCLLPSPLLAQAPIEEALLQQLTSPTLPSVQNQVLIQQEGISHRATIVQIEAQRSQIQVQQVGEAHQVEIQQQGQDNQWNIQQEGERHQFTGTLYGDNNQVQIQQFGQQNTIQQDLIGNGMDYSITQEGSQLELIQIEYSPLAPAYDVHQQGQGMTVIIEQGFSPNE
ncbi:hypothetical protein [Tunicatimonas pelagia]|uniref:hypothetical protein n=1 Tax=Tunicatimonas pelagia TaxID=931531 RepID=UPI0026668E45|nr:hypothetical protein [Tunicatimonas pelagia]WKN42134.1 hypothetical protein P0M28_24160 [Tunicatimonas pelagia]